MNESSCAKWYHNLHLQNRLFDVRDIPMLYGDIRDPRAHGRLLGLALPLHLPRARFGDELYRVRQSGEDPQPLEGTRQRLYFEEAERPITFQIYGDDPDLILKAALKVQELNPDIIDINMGCPAKSIADRGAGVGMMPTPLKIARTFRKLTSALRVPVTGKIPSGVG
jgi:hypothetical protein